MDGFIESLPATPGSCWVDPNQAKCTHRLGPEGQPDVMSTLTRQQIPNYWAYARRFVLADNFFSSEYGPTCVEHFFNYAAQSDRFVDCARDCAESWKNRQPRPGSGSLLVRTTIAWITPS